jgi:hypothetical protein
MHAASGQPRQIFYTQDAEFFLGALSSNHSRCRRRAIKIVVVLIKILVPWGRFCAGFSREMREIFYHKGFLAVKICGLLGKSAMAPHLLKKGQIRLTVLAITLEFADCLPNEPNQVK